MYKRFQNKSKQPSDLDVATRLFQLITIIVSICVVSAGLVWLIT